MAPTPYVKQTWIDGDSTKPTSAARLGVIETGVFDAHYRPSVLVYMSAGQSIATATPTILTWNTELYDTDGAHSTVTNTGRLVAPVAGKYLATARVNLAANATGYRQATLRLNGTTAIDEDFQAGSSVVSSANVISRPVLLSASDYLEIQFTHTAGSTFTAAAGQLDGHFGLHLLSY